MKKNAFTLIELLAVIVILAIVALIATPIILGIIRDAKEQANERSAENYLKAINTSIVSSALDNKKIDDGEYNIVEKGNICLKYDDSDNDKCIDELPVEIDGNFSTSGTIKINNGRVSNGTNFEIGGTFYKIANNELKKQLYKTYDDGDIVYIDVTTGKSCTNYHEDNSKTGYNGLATTKTTDNQNSCLKFYAFLDDGSKNLNLLLDHNTTAKLAWTTREITTNANGPVDVINQLKTDTDGWSIPKISNNYTYNHATRPYTINYNTEEYQYKARLITAQEIAQITGADKADTLNFKEETSTGWYYFHDYSKDATTGRGDVCKTDGCKYGWLYDRTATNCTDYGCLNNAVGQTYGYWTASAPAAYSNYAWFVYYYGRLHSHNVNNTSTYGVRPVITILKSNI